MDKLKYFSHDLNARNDSKLLNLRMNLKNEGIGIYWQIIEMLYENDGYLHLSECDRIAYELRVEEELIMQIIKNYGLFTIDNKQLFYSKSAIERIKKIKDISKQNSVNAKIRWSYKYATALQPQSDGNAIKEKKSKEKKIKENETIVTGKQVFQIPTEEEILNYIQENNYIVDYQKFYNFYQSKGWMVGKNKMKDWKAAVRTWHKSDTTQNDKKIGNEKTYDPNTHVLTSDWSD